MTLTGDRRRTDEVERLVVGVVPGGGRQLSKHIGDTEKTMRVYYYVCEHFGKDDLRNRHLKVSLIQSLNDPFEFLSVSLADPIVRQVLQKNKLDLSGTMGLLCFSETWRSPLMWAHYADNHKGLCLGFDIPEGHMRPVRYIRRRIAPPESLEMLPRGFVEGLFFKKFSHWRYEREYRAVVRLRECQEYNGLYFAPFSEKLALKQVIIGSMSELRRTEIESVLGEARDVEVFRTRPAFRTFRIVRQRRHDGWKAMNSRAASTF